ncbi:sulfurtransferase [Acrocarpospora catenulata]|uniref:sulfurtransferase n=1 Tax=Acrocarpospora catenulata TaxID=2836182 RepID=UPI001BD9FA47|nr:rhodanese-like domain-containing protein [Acrocarpospora catenulata]
MARYPQLISGEGLLAVLDDPDLVIADVRVRYVDDVARPDHDRYLAGHVPGAVFADLPGDFSVTADDGRQFGLPGAGSFAAAAGALGVGPGRHLVVYSEGWQIWATRLWWLFRYYGFDDVSVLDGGFQGWLADGHPVATGPEKPQEHVFEPRERTELVADHTEVEQISRSVRAGQLVHALPREFYVGEVATHGSVYGRIPNSVNLPWPTTADVDTGRYVPRDEIRQAAQAHLLPEGEGDVVAYCGAGVSATGLIFGLSLIGRDDVRLYDGSLNEWSRALGKPVERGEPRSD